jgi:hypothetical protein
MQALLLRHPEHHRQSNSQAAETVATTEQQAADVAGVFTTRNAQHRLVL